jgi:hypothetical protein
MMLVLPNSPRSILVSDDITGPPKGGEDRLSMFAESYQTRRTLLLLVVLNTTNKVAGRLGR